VRCDAASSGKVHSAYFAELEHVFRSKGVRIVAKRLILLGIRKFVEQQSHRFSEITAGDHRISGIKNRINELTHRDTLGAPKSWWEGCALENEDAIVVRDGTVEWEYEKILVGGSRYSGAQNIESGEQVLDNSVSCDRGTGPDAAPDVGFTLHDFCSAFSDDVAD
jgi:hypothetical protein